MATASTATGTTTINTGREISVKSRIKRAQSLTVLAKLRRKKAHNQHLRLAEKMPRKKKDILVSPAYTIAEHIVYARAERLLLNADNGPVVREDPGAPARREVRVRRCAENGARDTRHGRQWDAGEQQLNWEPEDRRVFSFAQKSTFF